MGDLGLIPSCIHNYGHQGTTHADSAWPLDSVSIVQGGMKIWVASTPPYACLGECVNRLGDLSCIPHDPKGSTVVYYIVDDIMTDQTFLIRLKINQ